MSKVDLGAIFCSKYFCFRNTYLDITLDRFDDNFNWTKNHENLCCAVCTIRTKFTNVCSCSLLEFIPIKSTPICKLN